MMKLFFQCLFLAAILATGCDMPSSGSGNTNLDTLAPKDTLSDSIPASGKEKRQVVGPSTTTDSAMTLMSLGGMTLESSMEIDEFRSRLEHDWGDVHGILMSSGGVFEDDGKGNLVVQGEVKQGGFTWAAIMIVDGNQDAVFAAQFDGENKRIDQFEEEKEGLKQPAPLTAWMKKYR